jgi:hypothetical protein
MGTYLYRISSSSFRKMTSGEKVYKLKYLDKPFVGMFSEPREFECHDIEPCLACYDYEQAGEVWRFNAGPNLWYDNEEDRRELVGHMLRDGKNRYRLVHGKLTDHRRHAYDLVESVGSSNYIETWDSFGASGFKRKWRKTEAGIYTFKLVKDGETVWSNSFLPSENFGYDGTVDFVEKCIKNLYSDAKMFTDKVQLKETG